MTPPPPIPLTLLTGPAGAGKTRLLNAALASPAMAGTLAILNEAGGSRLRRDLALTLEDGGGGFAGCLCCGPAEDVARLLEDALRRRDNGRIEPFARLVLETTGEGDPARIIATVRGHPYFSRRFVIAGVVVVLGGDFLAEPAMARATQAQIEAADVVVIADAGAGEALQARLARLNPGARIIRWSEAAADPMLVFAPGLHRPGERPDSARRAVYRHALGATHARETAR